MPHATLDRPPHSAFAAPLYTAEHEGQRLRAFPAPDGRAELPWFAVADLVAAAELSREAEVEAMARFGQVEGRWRLRTIVTLDGPVLLTDHPGMFLLMFSLMKGPSLSEAVGTLTHLAVVGGLAAARQGFAPAEAAERERHAWSRAKAMMKADLERHWQAMQAP